MKESQENLQETIMGNEVSEEEVAKYALARYDYILKELRSVNENTYRILSIYQVLVTALATAGLTLFVRYRSWQVAPDVARAGLWGILALIAVVALFAVLLLICGLATWFDYRQEECDLANEYFVQDFRQRPQKRNWWRWYETYILAFILVATAALWILSVSILLPRIS